MRDSERHRRFEAERQRRSDEVFAAHRGLLNDHRQDYGWLTGALGDPYAPVWFVAENPSLAQVERVKEPSPESQWLPSAGDQLFRQMLVEHGFKDGPAAEPGGWRCYITDVVKSPDRAGLWAKAGAGTQWQTVSAWAPVLRWEMEEATPRLLVSVGKQADRFLTRLEREGRLPPLPERRCIPHYSYVGGRPDKLGRRPGHPDRVAEYGALFAEIAHRARARGAK